MNFGVVVLLVVSGWAMSSIVVALAAGRMTDQRDGGAVPASARAAESTVGRGVESGCRDSNPGPSVPQTDALTKLRHSPLWSG